MQESPTDAGAGRLVRVRDQRWTVLDSQPFERVRLVRLRGYGDGNHGQLRSILTPFDIVEMTSQASTLRQRSRRRALVSAAAAVADAAPYNQCWTAAAANIELHAWQLEPAMAAITGATRILLADHVGLGKTIQASLILSELCARGFAERALVLTPASLRDQWAEEMRARFGLSPIIFDNSTLNATVASLPPGVNPWQTAPLIIASIDLVKRGEVRSAIDDVGFDVLIVDEAHHVAPGTDRGRLVADIASRTPWVVLATATPHGGDDAAFQFLRRIGGGEGDAMVTFRRSAVHLARRARRRSLLIGVAPTEAERTLLEAVTTYVRQIARARTTVPGVALVASVIARRAASSAAAVEQTLARRLALLAGEIEPEEQQPGLPWDEHDATDTDLPDSLLAAAAAGNIADEIESVKRLVSLAQAATARWSKADVIRRLLRCTREQVLVFSEFRDVALLAEEALRDATSIATLHGGLPTRERGELVRAFNDRRIRTLVATDAAGEGLNLQSSCRLVVNLELPWTPRRLEQRIGRVDRLGQTRRVHALHLIHRGSFEGTVVARLERRRSQAEARTPDRSASDDPMRPAMERRLKALAPQRQHTDSTGAAYSSRPRAVPQALHAGVVLLFGAALVSGDGRVLQKEVIPVVIELPVHRVRRLTRPLVRHLVAHSAVQNAIRDELKQRAAEAQIGASDVADALERRFATCVASLDEQNDRLRWQGSLFDRRAEQRAGLQRAHVLQLRAWLARKHAAAIALAAVSHAPPQLRAAWLV